MRAHQLVKEHFAREAFHFAPVVALALDSSERAVFGDMLLHVFEFENDIAREGTLVVPQFVRAAHHQVVENLPDESVGLLECIAATTTRTWSVSKLL